MPSIYRPPGCKKYRIAYINERGQRVNVPGFRDKQATLEKARKLERDAERARAGLPVAQAGRLHQPIGELTDLYLKEMERLGLSDTHVKETKRLLNRLWKECRWPSLASVRSDRLIEFLHQLKDAGRGPRTLNSYRDALRTFLEWCVGQNWLQENPIQRVKKARAKGKKTKPRRAYTVEEFHRLLIASPRHRDLYRVAGLSGLRKSELRGLEKRDLTPVGPSPTWHLRAEITKGRRKDVVPILPNVLPLVRQIWEGLPSPTSRMFPRIPRTQTLHQDIHSAGIQRIDAEGRCLDFHSLRYFFCTLLARSLSIQTVRFLMRHKNIKETCDLYMDLGLTDINEAILQLPPSLLPDWPPEGALQ